MPSLATFRWSRQRGSSSLWILNGESPRRHDSAIGASASRPGHRV